MPGDLVSLSDDVDDTGQGRRWCSPPTLHAVLERCGLPLTAMVCWQAGPGFCRRDVSWEDGIERWAADPAADRGVVMIGLLANAWKRHRGRRGEPGCNPGDRPGPAAMRTTMLQDAASVRAGVPSRLRILATGRPGGPQAAVIDDRQRSRAGVRCRPVRTPCRPPTASTMRRRDQCHRHRRRVHAVRLLRERCRGSGGTAGRPRGWQTGTRRRHGVDVGTAWRARSALRLEVGVRRKSPELVRSARRGVAAGTTGGVPFHLGYYFATGARNSRQRGIRRDTLASRLVADGYRKDAFYSRRSRPALFPHGKQVLNPVISPEHRCGIAGLLQTERSPAGTRDRRISAIRNAAASSRRPGVDLYARNYRGSPAGSSRSGPKARTEFQKPIQQHRLSVTWTRSPRSL